MAWMYDIDVKSSLIALLALVLALSGCGKPAEEEPNNSGGGYLQCVFTFTEMYNKGGYEATGMTRDEILDFCNEEYGVGSY